MNLQIDYLITFAVLAETKNFTKTGQQVNLSQSAVSMQIKRLEDEVGKKLFDRVGKTVNLTTEGKILINCHEADLNCVTAPLNEHKKSICNSVNNELFLITAMRPSWTAFQRLTTNIKRASVTL